MRRSTLAALALFASSTPLTAQSPTPAAFEVASVKLDPKLLEVFRSELGLKLVKNRATVNDFIVERAEPLIEN